MPRSPLQFQAMVAVVLALAITTAGFAIRNALHAAPQAETVCFQFHTSADAALKDLKLPHSK